MPKIVQYTAPEAKITPSDLGFSAWETAGRRIGPLYNQAAEDIKTGGELQAKEVENLGWVLPFDRFRAADASGRDRGNSLRIQNQRQGGGGGGRRGSSRMSPQGTNEASIGAPLLSGVAAHAAGGGKAMPNPTAQDQQSIDDAANQWYYGSGPNSASGTEGGVPDQYGSVAVQTGGVNADTDEYGNPAAATAGIPYAPGVAPQDESVWDNISGAAQNFGGWVSDFLGGSAPSAPSGGDTSGGNGVDDADNVPMD